jgi:hypothetical protein
MYLIKQIALKTLIELNKNSKESRGVSVRSARNTYMEITVSIDCKEYLVQFDITFPLASDPA